MIAVVDYGRGNLCSVEKAFRHLGAEAVVTSDAKIILSADKVVLPGVGAFGDAAAQLKARGLFSVLQQVIADGRPFLGICLGMQLLFEASEESVGAVGLGVFRGTVKKFPPKDKVPHIGWNDLQKASSPLFQEGSYVYFVHSFYAELSDDTAAETEYAGVKFSAAVACGNVYGAQFHPEKSGDAGMEILKRFIAL